MELNEVMLWLIASGYVKQHKDKWVFTAPFYKEMTGIAKGLASNGTVIEPNLPAITDTTVLVPGKKYTDMQWGAFYQQFILDCEIPAKCEGNYGNVYELNKYSIDGMKAFRKAMTEGLYRDVLVFAVKLYYKNRTKLKKAIGNYMLSEEWRTDYYTALAKHEAGQLDEHIKQELKHETGTRYTWG
jgi:hypothetical protein